MDRSYYLLSLLFFLLSTTLHGGYAEWKTFTPFSALPPYHDLSSEARTCVDGVQDLNLTSCENSEQLDPQGVVCLCDPKNFGDDNAPSYPEGGYLGVFWECCSYSNCSTDATDYLNLYCNSIDFASFNGSDDDAVTTTTTVTLGETTSDPVRIGPPIYRSETWWVVSATDYITSAGEISTQLSNSEATTSSEATTTPQPSHSSGVNAHSEINTPFDSTNFAGTTDSEAQGPARPTETSESKSKTSLFKAHQGPIIFGICVAAVLGIGGFLLFLRESRIKRKKMHMSDTEASTSHNSSQDTEERDQAEPLAHQPNQCPSPNPEPVSQLKERNGVNTYQEGIETAGPAQLAAEDTLRLRRRTAIYTQSIRFLSD
ncbi:hypothetical protein AOL_s00110g56 [Orbilia oligospora ATCC 24927]|uniref:Cyanovirin-N domain-containing protein n=1 Tax=Arthrobotrys oligospora (strain ATCC 24927 / CBS 115.81 / DSM 1491) TaxID=756982 RepID=G1XKN6_ARTOA|nr:hypothetical protein AOL_s00110g56 [Orbilia oligospora ATCC 24927]EGX46232.1 hypothetical protein AOL_s00110g56 [Orbilia oligospora ATCC 24927]